ncbi:MAG TPA: DsbE family thiol:disulfide interchange protein, partial [Xanthobacteraceae bacterium]
MRRVAVLVPLAIFLGLMVLFLFRLYAGDPSRIPSALISRPAPQTALPGLAGLQR